MTWMLRAGLALVALGAAPLVGLAIALAGSAALGCAVDEGNVTPCPIAGTDLGPLFYTLFTGGWLMLLTAPVGLVGLGLTIAALGLRASNRRNGDRGAG